MSFRLFMILFDDNRNDDGTARHSYIPERVKSNPYPNYTPRFTHLLTGYAVKEGIISWEAVSVWRAMLDRTERFVTEGLYGFI